MRLAAPVGLGVVSVMLVFPPAAQSQNAAHAGASGRRVSVHTLLGGYVPTGAQRRALDPAALIGVQAAIGVRPTLALVAGAAIAQTEDRTRPPGGNVNLVQYDVGVELGRASGRHRQTGLAPFVGAGVGGRTYDYAAGGVAKRFLPAGYVAAGAELALGRAGLRVEARDYLARYDGPGVDPSTRNDLALLAGLAYHFR